MPDEMERDRDRWRTIARCLERKVEYHRRTINTYKGHLTRARREIAELKEQLKQLTAGQTTC